VPPGFSERLRARHRALRVRGRERPARTPSRCAQHGRLLGGGSPLGEGVVLAPSWRQGRHREVGSGGSPRRDLGTEEHEPCVRRAGRVSLPRKAMPVSTKKASA
jgi:hypothetical protein